jgi:hypothetical protein
MKYVSIFSRFPFGIQLNFNCYNRVQPIDLYINLKRSMFDIVKLESDDVDWDNLRHAIYKKDDYKCQVCGAKGKLEGHYINHIHSDNRISNIIILCPSCHHKVTLNILLMIIFLMLNYKIKILKSLILRVWMRLLKLGFYLVSYLRYLV